MSAAQTASSSKPVRFDGTDSYVATDDLKLAVNAALTLQRPLLIKGEPGTGKTMLAEEVARALGRPLLQWHIKSTTKAHQGLYEYDAVSRLRDSQLGDEKVRDIRNYIVQGTLWQAFQSHEPVVLLIDEIDKADIEFPNDLLRELDRMEFHVYETRETIAARHRPLVIITSNNEKDLPDAFLRRCFFHYIRFPDRETMRDIVAVHYPDLKQDVLRAALDTFFSLRDAPGLKKKTLHVRTARLAAFAAGRRRHGRADRRAHGHRRAADGRRAAQERAGRASARTPGGHDARRPTPLIRHPRAARTC